MIKKINFRFGKSPESAPLSLELTPVTIFVGPNNSGKSKALIEIQNLTEAGESRAGDVIVRSIEFTPISRELVEKDLQYLTKPIRAGAIPNADSFYLQKISVNNNRMIDAHVNRTSILNNATTPNPPLSHYYYNYISLFTGRLDGTNRLNLLNQQPAGDLQATPQNHLMKLFQDEALRKQVRKIVYEAFEKYFVIDPTNIGHLRVRLSNREPADEAEEKNWDTKAKEFHAAALMIEEASDGVRAFTGIITTILTGDPRVLLVDEPEAFLHPSLAFKLGLEISKAMNSTFKRFIGSTHSANFLMGCIQSGVPVNIVRLTYKNDVPTARLLGQDKILHLMRNPLLRSVGVLNGLFYDSVIVTESDTDRSFYQEINERLLKANDARGIPNCLFLNAQNKQTVWDIVKPLRELGIPTSAIVDIDVIKDGGQVFTKTLTNTFIPEISYESLQQLRKAISDAFHASGRNMKRDGGVSILTGTNGEACNNLFNSLNEYGYFIVRNGELESWLPTLEISGHGPNWLIPIFEKMGEDPSSPEYLNPGKGDVWDFIGSIKVWVDNPNKKGIPN